jgi:hypothetical protein
MPDAWDGWELNWDRSRARPARESVARPAGGVRRRLRAPRSSGMCACHARARPVTAGPRKGMIRLQGARVPPIRRRGNEASARVFGGGAPPRPRPGRTTPPRPPGPWARFLYLHGESADLTGRRGRARDPACSLPLRPRGRRRRTPYVGAARRFPLQVGNARAKLAVR